MIDPKLRYLDKFGQTLTISELKQRWHCENNAINELVFAKEFFAYLDDRQAAVIKADGKRLFHFWKLAPEGADYFSENSRDCPQYQELPDNTYFYWTDILAFEDKNPEIKIRMKELETTEEAKPSELISYAYAIDKLKERLQATPHELAMWISLEDLNAYRKRHIGEIPFSFHPKDFIGNDDYINALGSLYFDSEEINTFTPKNRYISEQALIERWANPCRDIGLDAACFVDGKVKDSLLFEYHPISGRVNRSRGESSGVFELNNVCGIELQWFKHKSVQPILEDGAGGGDERKTKTDNKGRRNNQIDLICSFATHFDYKLLSIPENGKTAIKTECLKNTDLFTDSGFEHAWKEANKRNLISMKDKGKYR